MHRTEGSGQLVAAAMVHLVQGPPAEVLAESFEDQGRVSITATSQPGERLRLDKFVAYGWSAASCLQAMRDQVDAALTTARQTGWQGLLSEQREYLDDFWERADVEVDGDEEAQQAVRSARFHVLQAGARAE